MSELRRLPVLTTAPRSQAPAHRAFAPSVRTPERLPTYVRVVVTAKCPLACTYCHQEGDPAVPGREHGLSRDEWVALLSVAVGEGARKIKFLGGEPLVRTDLPDIVAALRALEPALDLSVITSGAVPVARITRLLEAGLSRFNVSIHGFGPEAFAARTRMGEAQRRMRDAFLDAVIAHGRPLKTNYVYTGPSDDADLASYLAFAAERHLLVNVLDDLGNPELDWRALSRVITGMRGDPDACHVEPDPHSLPTLRMRWRDGLEVELKSEQLGAVSPWLSCASCPVKSRCREGIHALRLGHDGDLRPCMDRPDLATSLRLELERGGVEAVRARYRAFVQELAR